VKCKHAKPAEYGFFKTIVVFFAVAVPFIALPFVVLSDFIHVPATKPLLERSEQASPVFSRYSPNQFPGETEIGYSRYVVSAMKEMGLSLDHFSAWISEHRESAIKHIKYMPSSMQKDVASIALFIRKSNHRIDEKTAWREAAALVHYSGKYGVPSALTTAVAAAESTFNPNALSSKGASGVMQVMWNIHNGLLRSNGIQAMPGKNPLADPERAIAAGCLLLSRYMRAYGSVQKAIDRYYGANSANYRRKINVNIAKLMTHRSNLFD
jgi:soluble lytic murein transglycosylase-like protein